MYRRTSKRLDWPRLAALVVLAIVLPLAAGACGKRGAKETPTPSGPTATPKPLSKLDFFKDIKQKRKDAIRVTDWEKYRDTLLGSRVQWTGWVLHIVEEEARDGQVEVRVGLDPPDALFHHYDAFFFLPREQASQLTKGENITFQGDIMEIKELAGTVDLVLTVELEHPLIVETPQ